MKAEMQLTRHFGAHMKELMVLKILMVRNKLSSEPGAAQSLQVEGTEPPMKRWRNGQEPGGYCPVRSESVQGLGLARRRLYLS